MADIDLDTTVSASGEILTSDVRPDEMVMMNIDLGRYYGLDAVGSEMFEHLRSCGRIEHAFRALREIFEVADERLLADLLDFAGSLASHKLLILQPGRDGGVVEDEAST